MTNWNHDISAAPRGKTVTILRTVKGEEKPFDETVIAPVWLATKCGRVIKSYWLEKTKFSPARWAGLAVNEAPVAWQDFVTPEHPFNQSDAGAIAAVKAQGRLANATSVEPSASDLITREHVFLDDVGGSV